MVRNSGAAGRRAGRSSSHLPHRGESAFYRRPQKIAFFAAEEQPISLAVLLNASSSMRSSGKYDQAKEALWTLLRAGQAGSQFFCGEFSNHVEYFAEVAADGHRQAILARSLTESGGTALYDSITVALCLLGSARYPRQVLVVATDGADQHSRLRLGDLIAAAQASRPQIFILGYFDPAQYRTYQTAGNSLRLATGQDMDNPLHVFGRLAQESGADAYYPDSEASLRRAVDAVRQRLMAQYTLAYYLGPSPHHYRRIEVKVKRHGVKVRARHGFSATAPDELAASATSAGGCAIDPVQHPYPFEARLKVDGGRMVYREDFSDPATGWPNRGDTYYRAGAYHMLRVAPCGGGSAPASPMDESLTTTTVAYGPWWGDFRASVSLDLLGQAGAEGMAGLAFRLNDAGYYALVLSANGSQFKLVRAAFSQGRDDPTICCLGQRCPPAQSASGWSAAAAKSAS